MNLNQSIKDLLHENECVIIPQFGGFIANYRAAFVHPKTEMIHPPSKQISFNVNLKNNDGLLANYISQKHEVPYQVASDFVNSTVKAYTNELRTGNRLELEGIGTLAVNSSGSIEFAPSNSINFLRSSFGLSPVFLPSLSELIPQESDAAIPPVTVKETPIIPIETAVEESETAPKRKVNRKWIAAAVIAPFLFFGGYTAHQNSANVASFLDSVLIKKSVVKNAAFIPRFEDEKIQFSYEEPVNQLKLIADQNPELQSVFYSFETAEISPSGLKILLSEDTPLADHNSSNETTGYARKSSALELYFIVAGCFKERNNADGLVKKLRRKGFDAGIFGKKGSLHLVCYGSYTNKSAAKSALSEIKSSENPGAWLKKH